MADRPPRLLHLADYAAPYAGSFIPMVAELARTARGRDWPVELVFPETARAKSWLGDLDREEFPYRFIDLHSAGGPARWPPAFAAEATGCRWRGRVSRSISALMAEYPGPTILHTQFTMFDIPAAQAARTAERARVIWHEQSARPGGRIGELGGTLHYHLFARDVSAFVCVAPDIAEVVARQGGGDRVSVLPNAVDTRRFSPDCLDRRLAVRQDLGLPPQAVVLLLFGAHWERKGGDVFLATIRALLDGSRAAAPRGLIVGQAQARAAVRAAGLESAVTVIAPSERVEDLYAASDIFVSPSRAEGMPFAVLEALAVGIPVVASDIPGQAAIADAVAACRVTAAEPPALAAAILDVVELDAAARRAEQAAAREWIVENAGLQAWAATLTGIYDRVLAGIP